MAGAGAERASHHAATGWFSPVRASGLSLALACGEAEVQSAQALRFAVFAREMGGALSQESRRAGHVYHAPGRPLDRDRVKG